MKKLFTILPLILLISCSSGLENPAPKTSAMLGQDFSDKSKSFRAQVADIIFPEVNHESIVEPPPKVLVHPFCYKTWDKPACFDKPELGEDARLVGNY